MAKGSGTKVLTNKKTAHGYADSLVAPMKSNT